MIGRFIDPMQELFARYLFHWTPERAIWLGGHSLSWDARCAGIYAGFGIALLFHLIFRRHQTKLPPWSVLATAAVLSLPLFIDVFTIHFELRVPLNAIRHLTGVLFGIPLCCLLYPAVIHLYTDSKPSIPLSHLKLGLVAAAGSAISALTLWDHALSYYLLETLSWLGFGGLAALSITGFFALLRPAALYRSQ